MSTTTITLINPPGSSPNGQWTQGQPWPWNQQTWLTTPSHRTTTVTISVPKGSTRSTISVIPSYPASSVTTITITAGQLTQPIQPPPITPSITQSLPWTSLTTTTVPWARSSDDPWSVPPKPPVDFTPGVLSEVQPSSSKPAPWRPPPIPGGSWTSVSDPTIPLTPIVIPQPTPTPTPTQVKPTSTTSTTTATLGPPPPLPPVPAKCGPGMSKCIDNTYCDPQPLCSIGEDCPGICLPILNTDYVNVRQSCLQACNMLTPQNREHSHGKHGGKSGRNCWMRANLSCTDGLLKIWQTNNAIHNHEFSRVHAALSPSHGF
jgi:hypothetical protein